MKSMILLSLMLSQAQAAVQMGGEVSGGADTFVVPEAFFRSSDPGKMILVCYEKAENFGVPDPVVVETLRWAFEKWDSYIEAKDLDYAVWGGSPGIVGKVSDEIRKGCSGTEDLRVYLGVEHPDVTLLRPKFYNPYAFPAIVENASGTIWHKGLLWVSGLGGVKPELGIPDWTQGLPSVAYGAFKYMVLHEVGHIFGNEHVSQTIMTARIGQWLEDWTRPGNSSGPTLSKLEIDQVENLIPNLNLEESFTLARAYGCETLPSGGESCPDFRALEKAFEKIFGKKPLGKLKATAKRLEKPGSRPHERPDWVENGTGPIDLEFRDDQGVYKARISTRGKVGQKNSTGVLFNGQHGNHYTSFGTSLSGDLEVVGRPKIPVIVNFNMGDRFTVVEFDRGTSRRPLLTTFE